MNLVKVNQININYQNNKQIIANYVPDFVGTQGEYYELLGTYATKERALEVLDEIQEILFPKAIFKTISAIPNFDDDLVFRPKEEFEIKSLSNVVVYEMPLD